MAKKRKAPWKKTNPRKKAGKSSKVMTPAKKAVAKTRAKKAGRSYPNLVDNMWAASKKKKSRKKKTAKKSSLKKTSAKKTRKKKAAKSKTGQKRTGRATRSTRR